MRKSTATIFIILALLVGGAAGWYGRIYYQDNQEDQTIQDSTEQVEETEDDSQILFTNLYRGDGTKNTYTDTPDSPTVLLIESQAELDSIWPDMFSGVLPPPKPTIDFNSQSILVAMLAQKDTDGYLATIKSIMLENGSLNVELDDKIPGNACRTEDIPTRPIHVVAITKLSVQNVKVQLSISNAAPCAIPL